MPHGVRFQMDSGPSSSRDDGSQRRNEPEAAGKAASNDISAKKNGKQPMVQDEKVQHDVCVICMEELLDEDVSGEKTALSCDHVFHHECIVHWLSQSVSCPTCRRRVCMNSVLQRRVDEIRDERRAQVAREMWNGYDSWDDEFNNGPWVHSTAVAPVEIPNTNGAPAEREPSTFCDYICILVDRIPCCKEFIAFIILMVVAMFGVFLWVMFFEIC